MHNSCSMVIYPPPRPKTYFKFKIIKQKSTRQQIDRRNIALRAAFADAQTTSASSTIKRAEHKVNIIIARSNAPARIFSLFFSTRRARNSRGELYQRRVRISPLGRRETKWINSLKAKQKKKKIVTGTKNATAYQSRKHPITRPAIHYSVIFAPANCFPVYIIHARAGCCVSRETRREEEKKVKQGAEREAEQTVQDDCRVARRNRAAAALYTMPCQARRAPPDYWSKFRGLPSLVERARFALAI